MLSASPPLHIWPSKNMVSLIPMQNFVENSIELTVLAESLVFIALEADL